MLECLMAAWIRQLFNYFFKDFGITPVSLKICDGDTSHFELYFSLQAINADIFDSKPLELITNHLSPSPLPLIPSSSLPIPSSEPIAGHREKLPETSLRLFRV